MLFEVAILEVPTKKEKEEGGCEKLISGPEFVIANDEQLAAVSVVLEKKGSLKVDKNRMKILVRPFV